MPVDRDVEVTVTTVSANRAIRRRRFNHLGEAAPQPLLGGLQQVILGAWYAAGSARGMRTALRGCRLSLSSVHPWSMLSSPSSFSDELLHLGQMRLDGLVREPALVEVAMQLARGPKR